jgi:hypothetical protein
MQPHRLRDCRAERAQQMTGAQFFVSVVDAVLRAVADIIE